MSRNWLRAGTVEIDGAGSIDMTQLRVRFHVLQRVTGTPNGAEVRIYNLSSSTSEKIIKNSDKKKLTLTAGYVGNSGGIYSGKVIRAQRGRENPTDTFVDVFCSDDGPANNHGVANKTFAAGSTQRDHVDYFLKNVWKEFGVTEGLIKGLSDVKYPRAVTFFGMARDFMRTIAHSNEASWYFLNGKLYHIPNDDEGRSGAFKLNANTGLIGMPVETNEGIIVTALINPQFEVGRQLIVDEKSINRAPWALNLDDTSNNTREYLGVTDGTYKIQAIEWRGDSRGDEWYATMVCFGAKTGSQAIGTQKYLGMP